MATQAQNCRSHQLRSHLPLFFMQRPSLGLQQCPYVLKSEEFFQTSESPIAHCHDKILFQVILSSLRLRCKVMQSLDEVTYLHIELGKKNMTIHFFFEKKIALLKYIFNINRNLFSIL